MAASRCDAWMMASSDEGRGAATPDLAPAAGWM